MAMAAICDDTTGEIVAYVIVPDGDLAANVASGQVAVDITEPVSGELQYVDDPTGTPSIIDRPTMDAVIPSVATEGLALSIPDVPDGASITIT